MGIGYIYAAFAGDLPPEFAFRTAFNDVLIALGALALWAFYRPESPFYRGLLLIWNTYGFMAAMATDVTLTRAHPGFPASHPSLDIYGYFSGFPEAWVPLFWVGLSLCIHAVIFFKLFSDWRSAPAPV